MKNKQFIGEQRKVNKCRTKSGKKKYIALCIVVKYINGTHVIYLDINSLKPLIKTCPGPPKTARLNTPPHVYVTVWEYLHNTAQTYT